MSRDSRDNERLDEFTLTPEDMNLVLRRVPADLLQIVKRYRFYLAGGFIRATIAGNETPTDIDLFGSDKTYLEQAAQELTEGRSAKLHETDNAYTVLGIGRIPIQLIHRFTFSSVDQLIEHFDFTIAKAVIWWEPGDLETGPGRWRSTCDARFYSDLAARRLRYVTPPKPDAGSSLLRVRKFLARGYNIQTESLAFLLTAIIRQIQKLDTDTHFNDDAWLLRVVIGILRQVDPLEIVDGVDIAPTKE